MKPARCTLTLALALAGLGAVACNTKITQCNKLIEKANQAMQSANDVQAKLDGKDDAKDLGQIADLLDNARKEIAVVDLSDATLKGYQGDYAKSLDRMSTAVRAEKAAIGSSDTPAASAAVAEINAAEADNKSVVEKINKYCGGA